MKKTTVLVVLDGFGHSDSPEDNAILAARTPTWDRYWAALPHTLISGSGTDVGLPDGQMGNSEVGHMNLGAGRVVYQELTRINRALELGEFGKNPMLNRTFDRVRSSGGTLHVMGLLSPGGVHSHEEQILGLFQIAATAGDGFLRTWDARTGRLENEYPAYEGFVAKWAVYSPDGTELYACSSTAGPPKRFDPTTLAPLAPFAAGGFCRRLVALTGATYCYSWVHMLPYRIDVEEPTVPAPASFHDGGQNGPHVAVALDQDGHVGGHDAVEQLEDLLHRLAAGDHAVPHGDSRRPARASRSALSCQKTA